MRFAASVPPAPRTTAAPGMEVMRDLQAQTLAEIRLFQRRVRQETERAVLQGHIDAIVDRMRAQFAGEERYLRVISHPSYAERCHAHKRLFVELALECLALEQSDRLPIAQMAHLFDAYLIHQATTTAVDRPAPPRNLASVVRSAFAARVAAEMALASPGARELESEEVA